MPEGYWTALTEALAILGNLEPIRPDARPPEIRKA
jgi:hypothetical protein